MERTYKTLLEAIFASSHDYDAGDCGSLIRTVKAFADAIKAYGVVAYDGDLVHIVGKIDGQYFDGAGIKSVDQIKQEWSFDMDPELVRIVKVELVNDQYVYGDKAIDADIIDELLGK